MKRRQTKQAASLRAVLAASDQPLAARELHARMGNSVGLATVYRNLQRFVAEGVADTFRRESGEQAYRICSAGHHHHLVCRGCGVVKEVRDQRLERTIADVARSLHFHAPEHELELTGICPSCAITTANRP